MLHAVQLTTCTSSAMCDELFQDCNIKVAKSLDLPHFQAKNEFWITKDAIRLYMCDPDDVKGDVERKREVAVVIQIKDVNNVVLGTKKGIEATFTILQLTFTAMVKSENGHTLGNVLFFFFRDEKQGKAMRKSIEARKKLINRTDATYGGDSDPGRSQVDVPLTPNHRPSGIQGLNVGECSKEANRHKIIKTAVKTAGAGKSQESRNGRSRRAALQELTVGRRSPEVAINGEEFGAATVQESIQPVPDTPHSSTDDLIELTPPISSQFRHTRKPAVSPAQTNDCLVSMQRYTEAMQAVSGTWDQIKMRRLWYWREAKMAQERMEAKIRDDLRQGIEKGKAAFDEQLLVGLKSQVAEVLTSCFSCHMNERTTDRMRQATNIQNVQQITLQQSVDVCIHAIEQARALQSDLEGHLRSLSTSPEAALSTTT